MITNQDHPQYQLFARTEGNLRIAALAAAACGILSAVVFAYRWDHTGELLRQSELYRDYIIIALAAAVSRGRATGFVVAAAAIAIFILGAFTYLDLLSSPGLHPITLLTLPWQHYLAILAILVAVIGLFVFAFRAIHRRIR